MATYVLVHGTGHGGWCFRPVATMLRAQGHRVYAPTLTGLGHRAHLISASVDLDCHIRDIGELLRFEDLRDVILVGHGYGGMVITGAADRMHHRVGHLVYLNAAAPANGQSLMDVAPGAVGALRRYVTTFDGVDLYLAPLPDVLPIYGVSDPATIRWMVPRLTPHPWRCFEQPLHMRNEEALVAIAQSHITSGMSRSCRDVDHLRAIARGRVWELETGHDVMLTEPASVADKLAAIVEWLPARRDP